MTTSTPRVMKFREKRQLHLAALAFSKLTKDSLDALHEVEIHGKERFLANLNKCGCPKIFELSVIKKCNAYIIVWSCETQVGAWSMLDAWDVETGGLMGRHRDCILCYSGCEAIKYLLETSAGLHSVVVGDSQVLAQIRDPIKKSCVNSDRSSQFKFLVKLVTKFNQIVHNETSFKSGVTSLERVAVLELSKRYGKKHGIAVVGAGKTGRLLLKIISEDWDGKRYLSSRNNNSIKELAHKYAFECSDFNRMDYIAHAKILIIALPNSIQVCAYIKRMFDSLRFSDETIAIVDFSTPSILSALIDKNNSMGIDVIDVTDLSILARSNIDKRAAEIEKVKLLLSIFVENHVGSIL